VPTLRVRVRRWVYAPRVPTEQVGRSSRCCGLVDIQRVQIAGKTRWRVLNLGQHPRCVVAEHRPCVACPHRRAKFGVVPCRRVQPTSPTRRSRGTSRRYVCALGTGMVGCSCVGLMALTCGTGPAFYLPDRRVGTARGDIDDDALWLRFRNATAMNLMPKYWAHRAVPGRSHIHSPCRHSGDEHVPPVRVKHARGQQCRASLHVPDHSEGAPAAFAQAITNPWLRCLA
jgi:hypothetical protein